MLKSVDERYDTIFPQTWRVQHCILMAFLQQTRQHILEILEGRDINQLTSPNNEPSSQEVTYHWHVQLPQIGHGCSPRLC